jgi:hypothetical protein
MEIYQYLTLGLGAVGFLLTWILGAFRLGRAVEQMRMALREEANTERDKILEKIEVIENRFIADQKSQDHNFGEVGAAMRQYIADVEKKLREVEIYGRDNYVKIVDFEKALDRVSSEIKSLASDIKKDLRDLKSELVARPTS